MILDWNEIIIEFLKATKDIVIKLIGVLIVLLIGWFIAVLIGKIIAEVLKRLGFNKIFEKGNWKEALEKAELKIDPSGFIGWICKWIIFILFLLIAVDILGLEQFGGFLNDVLNYLPNVVIAALIFIVAVIVAEILEKVVRTGVESIKVGYGGIAGGIVKWSIWIFAIWAILIQLGILSEMLLTLFTGLVAMISIAGGIAFGLGGKEVAAEILQHLKKKLKG